LLEEQCILHMNSTDNTALLTVKILVTLFYWTGAKQQSQHLHSNKHEQKALYIWTKKVNFEPTVLNKWLPILLNELLLFLANNLMSIIFLLPFVSNWKIVNCDTIWKSFNFLWIKQKKMNNLFIAKELFTIKGRRFAQIRHILRQQ
jgi:hypothetical protein